MPLVKSSKMVTVDYESEKNKMWQKYDDVPVNNCITCDHAKHLSAGGRYKPFPNPSIESTKVSEN